MRESPYVGVALHAFIQVSDMTCSTCGERLAVTDSRCPVCGAAVTLPSSSAPPLSVRRCPRCRYVGEGVGYFRRPGHLLLLACVSLFTYGIGGLCYWFVRRRRTVCPNCGFSWEGPGQSTLPPPMGQGMQAPERVPEPPLPPGGLNRRVLGIAMVLVAAFPIVAGIVEYEVAAVAVGGVLGAVGTGTYFWGWRALQDRRVALTNALERRVLQLATHHGGTLMVTEVAAELDLSLPAAERVLTGMDDGFRVRSDVTDEGILLFEFPEVRHRQRLASPEAPPRPSTQDS